MKARLRRIAIALLVLAALALALVGLGVVPLAASAGHWAVTDVLLHGTMRHAVKVRALFVEKPPNLDEPGMIMRGAGHYASGCAPCHGAPGAAPSAISRHMAPPPPVLETELGTWEPRQLFWIVRHGIKFTGMPAWPAQQRPDEVWAMVAFLRRLPTLSAATYRYLAYGGIDEGRRRTSAQAEAAAGNAELVRLKTQTARLTRLSDPPRLVLETCERCHGADGLGRIPGGLPRIAGQSETYLAATLTAYAGGERFSGIMEPVAAALDEQTIQALARHFSRLPAVAVAPDRGADVDLGERIARVGIPSRKVAACVPCHGPGGRPRNPYYPLLAGQDPGYLVRQLELFIAERRGGTPWAQVMRISAHRLTDEAAEAVAAYYAGLIP